MKKVYYGGNMTPYQSIQWIDGVVRLLDQRLLPHQVVYRDYQEAISLAQAIKDMVIRGAPAIGAAAGYGMALTAVHSRARTIVALQKELHETAKFLRQARPTAYDLFGAVAKILQVADEPEVISLEKLRENVISQAQAIANANGQINRQIGRHALPLIPDKVKIIHHCNTGSLATVEYGTALGVVRAAHENGKQVFVFVDETRPRLQGSRLTSWELLQLGIPHAVIVDSASGHFMRTVGIDLCLVGCDRIAANGDTANKVGTYNLAVVARAHKVPFYVVGPTTTIDVSISNGSEIQIEERPSEEITHLGEIAITPEAAQVYNPAFDVTPAEFISAIITEKGVVYPPYDCNLAQVMAK